MTEHVRAVPEELRQTAGAHSEFADGLAPVGHAEAVASLDSLGPVFAEVREAGRALLDQRLACYEQQAAVHAGLADRLSHVAGVWEEHDGEAAGRLGSWT